MPRRQANQPAPPKGVQLRAGGLGPGEVLVPTDELAAVLIPAIDKMNAELNYNVYEGCESQSDGAMQIIAERSAKALGTRVDSVPRRLYSIRTAEFKGCAVRIADALLLAVDIKIEETDIVHLPQGMEAAREMVDAYYETIGKRPSKTQKEALAKKIVRFKNGYLYHEKYQAKAEAKAESDRWIEERQEQLGLEEVAA